MIKTLGDYVVQTVPQCDDILPMSVDDALGCTAVIISGNDLVKAHAQFCDGMPWPDHVLVQIERANRCEVPDDVSVTWFGDHARFIAANWRR